MAGKIGRKLTDKQIDEMIDEYMQSRVDPNREPITQEALAKKYGVSQSTVSLHITNSNTMERLRRRVYSNVVLAQAMAQAAAPKVMEETIRSAFKKRDEKFEYINQGDRRDILDRAGVRTEKESSSKVEISFASGEIPLGMPEESVDVTGNDV